MKFFLKAVVTGFALTLGAAIFKKLAPYVGLDEKKPKEDADDDVNQQDAATDPGLQ
jgi:hypothetical protein